MRSIGVTEPDTDGLEPSCRRGSLRGRWRGALAIPLSAPLLALLAVLALSALLIVFPVAMKSAQAQSSADWQSDGQPVRHVTVTVNKSRTFQLGQPFSTAVVGAPD